MNRIPLTPEEAAAVRFYEGDLTGLPADDAFCADEKAYVSINALLFPGIGSEITRVKEGKRLNPAIPADLPRLSALYLALLSAAKKGAKSEQAEGFRVERAADFSAVAAAGRTLAFTSTGTGGFLPAYGDKNGIVLLHFTVPTGTPCIDMAQMLPVYRKAEEQELLLPPFLPFWLSERPLTGAERQITDQNGDPPSKAYEITLSGQFAPCAPAKPPLPFSGQALSVWESLNNGADPAALPETAVRTLLRCKKRLTAWLMAAASQ